MTRPLQVTDRRTLGTVTEPTTLEDGATRPVTCGLPLNKVLFEQKIITEFTIACDLW